MNKTIFIIGISLFLLLFPSELFAISGGRPYYIRKLYDPSDVIIVGKVLNGYILAPKDLIDKNHPGEYRKNLDKDILNLFAPTDKNLPTIDHVLFKIKVSSIYKLVNKKTLSTYDMPQVKLNDILHVLTITFTSEVFRIPRIGEDILFFLKLKEDSKIRFLEENFEIGLLNEPSKSKHDNSFDPKNPLILEENWKHSDLEDITEDFNYSSKALFFIADEMWGAFPYRKNTYFQKAFDVFIKIERIEDISKKKKAWKEILERHDEENYYIQQTTEEELRRLEAIVPKKSSP